jgi:hypothetical protein
MEERDHIDEYIDICRSIFERLVREDRLHELDEVLARNKAEIE